MAESSSTTKNGTASAPKTAASTSKPKTPKQKPAGTAAKRSAAKAAKPAPKAAAKRGRIATAGSAVDVPVGVVLSAADRMTNLVTPWTDRAGAEKKVRAYRNQLEDSLQKAEKRGAEARSDAQGRLGDRISSLQGDDRLKVLTDRAEKLQTELGKVISNLR